MQITNSHELEAAIIEYEKKLVIQKTIVVSQWHETKESFKPKNILKNAVHQIADPESPLGMIMKAVGGLSMGFLTQKLLLGKAHSLPKKILGTALNLTTTGTIFSQAERLKAYGLAIYHNLIKKSERTA
ncbi:MAG: hypothetical protein ABIY51_08785 [Ferruginibacter sp.]